MALKDENLALKEQVNNLITLNTTLNLQYKKFENVISIKEQFLKSKDTELKSKDTELKSKDTLITCLQEALALERLKKYSTSSERLDVSDKQESLFNEAEAIVLETPDDIDNIEIKKYSRKINRGKRKPLPNYLSRERREYRLSAEQLTLSSGEKYEEIGFDSYEQLEVVPATVKVIDHIRYKYAVKGKEELGVITAEMPTQAIPKSIASSGLLAHIVQSKFCYHLPLYRQESIWKSFDIDIHRSSMSRWMLALGNKSQPIVDDIMEQIKLQTYIQADETPVTVINDSNKKEDRTSHQGYMWVYNNKAGVVYEYQSSRSGKHPEDKLEEFKGYVQSDAYAGYNCLFKPDSKRISVGCWAHARRKFVDVIKVSGTKAKKGYSHKIVAEISKLYRFEEEAKQQNLSTEAITTMRQEKGGLNLQSQL